MHGPDCFSIGIRQNLDKMVQHGTLSFQVKIGVVAQAHSRGGGALGPIANAEGILFREGKGKLNG
ncbi:hypothetical protein SDC9_196368 [bioreactor metagenome]|uniref:Uncharacterized protein n=1 Tax=bioreactor metagenome TaxID=1076179 RepID=A0A645ICX2_9ZZZZ